MFRLSQPSAVIRATAQRIIENSCANTDAEKAQALYRFVQSEIVFGFTSKFDAASPEDTLRTKRGHCNPQGALFTSLCNAAGLTARQHFVELTNHVLRGVLAPSPPTLLHSYVEVELLQGDKERTVRLDGYIADPELFKAAQAQLLEEGAEQGYGVHVRGCSEWDGVTDCFVQMADEHGQVRRDLGVYDVPLELYRSADNFQRLPLLISWTFGLLARSINARIASIRSRKS